MFIQIESTPNPDTLKFLLSAEVVGMNSGAEFLSADDAQASPLARLLFEVEGVEKVFFGGDFVSITKAENILWEVLKPEVLVVMTDYCLLQGTDKEHVQASAEDEEKEFFDEKDSEIVQQVKELIENYVKPAVAQDGGDIKFRGYKEGVVFVKLRGACSGCPSAAVTLKDGVYGMLSYYIPAIKAVESI
ncbi:Fe/S biogenesis protein NfuA [Anaplasma phagocytophilum]|uniref:Fe/S biogenesis protein NfuA n=3 Tax=Anaplasma phagocytophilum TaxID=948 RepID=A0A098EG23_ANAPH|nr:NifU family protein [Anaplasma phagocytophilum]KJV64935.1 scaffold Nfu/NifU N terminal family protein [Anaplasma phagocytophilum str. ApMUC09]KJV67953.1 scaffold Nfu/NifU N terminal family protein [Anaplasma phagocytophilum str. ApNP]CEG20732.1 NifU domain protein [Anaplasma phagocytophilum]SBO14211.1 Fe/S biogenesis protein NfuA [Anaplasma phagocytophilum]SBO31393.1 Fe/S biogenesis protein NfuA [Anaplasma phagocytophilum]